MLRCNIAFAAALGCWAAVWATGCGDDGASRTCVTDTDCASGLCLRDGTCAPLDGPDGGVQADAMAGGDGGSASCTPNHDGTLMASELPLVPGRTATFRVALDTAVDTAGTALGNGTRQWSLDGPLSGDTNVGATLLAIDGTWFAASFATATYATKLSETEDLLGVFSLRDTGLYLVGVVSPAGGLTRTELSYEPPVAVLPLPMSDTSNWTTSTTVSGLAQGIAAYYTESYQSRVDAHGTLTTPYGEFPVRRVRIELSRTVGLLVTSRVSFAFVAECYGTVASIVSKDYDTGIELTEAAEVRRLSP